MLKPARPSRHWTRLRLEPASRLEGAAAASRPSLDRSSSASFSCTWQSSPTQFPLPLAHIVEGSSEQMSTNLSMRLAETRVISRDAPALGPPLRGHGYVAGDGCCDSIRHVRALLPLNGAFYLAQRFAIDWEQIDD